ncbi:hypothetical protein GLOTRDRAFT_130764 [Gloeophyllum trabeum ATCC 11539]|uniref:Uncharacterized protein n=1 Tax=Gloeophyllum trabeum (strain ATCC 11539 / FP-39264 / Madison 617) TaxID=670483 RepID=S7Q0I0_GLOTA|nr:uncharacterized protein GLOTRDRAFT_130764 [Gloeophyllum trabeum ATCC 11539]EPQ53426.1 hypothetical protein GLOTRDRAFT_130764 [Gloeophyllum trabeum ATCC 11539]
MSTLQTVAAPRDTTSEPAQKPRHVRTVERWIVGGIIITYEEAVAWANRLRATRGDFPLEATRIDYYQVLVEIQERVLKLRGRGAMYWGYRIKDTVMRTHMMIMTRYESARVPVVNGVPTLTPAQKRLGPVERMAQRTLKEQEQVQYVGYNAYPSNTPPYSYYTLPQACNNKATVSKCSAFAGYDPAFTT